MKSALLYILLGASVIMTGAQAEIYEFDPGHTEVRFYYTHAGLSEQSGEWRNISGTVDFDPDNVTATATEVAIDATSVDTGVEPFDEHLMSGDFFEVDTYPQIVFVSTDARQTGPEQMVLSGNLTIKDITAPLELNVTLNHIGPHPLARFSDFYQGEWIGFAAEGEVLRSTYEVDLGAPLTSDLVRIEIAAEMRAGGW